MGQMLVATLREGIEAFLIVAIAAACLRRTGRAALLPAVAWGTVAGISASAVLGIVLAEWAVVPLHEGILALVAAVLVLSMVAVMARSSKRMHADIGERLEAASARPSAWLGVFLFTLLMIAREGMEMAFITVSIARNEGSAALVAGAIGGMTLAALLALAWVRWGHRVNLGAFLQATSLFLSLFALQLLFYAFHEFTEAGVLPIDNAYWHVATESWAEGAGAQAATAVMVLAPIGWLCGCALRRRSFRPRPTS